jgi:hypothetical protein
MVALQKEQKRCVMVVVVAHRSAHCVVTMTLMSTCDDFVEPISSNVMIDAMTAMKVMEYSNETCDIDMLMVVSYHQFAADDDIALVGGAAGDVDRICAVGVAVVAIHPTDSTINLPLNLLAHVRMALN